MSTGKLSHYDDAGEARMVDVSAKAATNRTARAHAFVRMSAEVIAGLASNPKGDPARGGSHRRHHGVQANRGADSDVPSVAGEPCRRRRNYRDKRACASSPP